MGRPNYYSAFAEHISKFLDYRENSGIKYMYPDYVHLKNLDNFFIQEGITNISFSRDQAVKWKQQLENESKSTQYDRINITKRFLNICSYKDFRYSNLKTSNTLNQNSLLIFIRTKKLKNISLHWIDMNR